MDTPASLPDSPEGRLRAVENEIKYLEELTHAIKVYRNTLVPISRLPAEILSIIFSLLPAFEVFYPRSSPPILHSPVSHVCRLWREISLDQPLLWNHINFTKLTQAGAAAMLARAKMAPLHLVAWTTEWSRAKFEAFKGQIEAHIHHTRRLSIKVTPKRLEMFGQVVSSAPSLESLSIDNRGSHLASFSRVIIPDNLFDGIAPKLTYLRLSECGIHLQSPLLKGLRDLELYSFPKHARTIFYSWLRALEQMPQLERLVLYDGIPSDLVELSEGLKFTVVLPSLTELRISTIIDECAVLLPHLVLPALTRLRVNVKIDTPINGLLNHLIQCVAQNAYGPQDTEELQSLFIWGNETRAAFVAWTIPRTRPARLEFSIQWQSRQSESVMNIQHYNAMLAALPLNSITNLTIKGRTPLGEEDWRSHASRWHKLQRVGLFDTAVPAFRAMFQDAAVLGDHPLLPSLEELVLIDISLNAQKVNYLYDMLMKRVELGTPLRTLDMRTCTLANNRAVQLLNEIVADVQGPVKKESGGLSGRRRGSAGPLGEEGGSEEEDGFDRVTPCFGSWDIRDSHKDSHDDHRFDSTFEYGDYNSDDSSTTISTSMSRVNSFVDRL